jgi:hypothetical protein
MKKLIACGLMAAAASSGVNAAPKSFGSVEVGFENITYRENISIFGRELSQDSNILNPIQHTLSYTAFDNKDYGFYLESTSTLFENFDTETWELDGYGPIQTNDLMMSSIDVKLQGAYNVAKRSQIIGGLSFFVLDFTRSSLARAAGGDAFHTDIVNGVYDAQLTAGQIAQVDCDSDGPGDGDNDGELGFCTSPGSVSESQNSVEFLLGYVYDTNLGLSREFSWYAQAELALPIWHRTANSNFQGEVLDEFGGGWGVNTRAGLRWSVSKKVNVTLGAVANYKTREQVTKTVSTGTLSVPEVEYTNIQFLAGLVWYL